MSSHHFILHVIFYRMVSLTGSMQPLFRVLVVGGVPGKSTNNPLRIYWWFFLAHY